MILHCIILDDRRKKFKNTTTSIEACSSRYMKMKNGYNDLLCKRKMPVSDQVTKMKFTQSMATTSLLCMPITKVSQALKFSANLMLKRYY